MVLSFFFFLRLFVTSGITHVCIFHVKEQFPLVKHAVHRYTHTYNVEMAVEDSAGILRGWIRADVPFCFCFLGPLTSLIMAPGVVY